MRGHGGGGAVHSSDFSVISSLPPLASLRALQSQPHYANVPPCAHRHPAAPRGDRGLEIQIQYAWHTAEQKISFRSHGLLEIGQEEGGEGRGRVEIHPLIQWGSGS